MDTVGRRALVTGAGGFVGSHLVERLLGDGYQVRGFVRYTSTPRLGWLDDLPAGKRAAVEIAAGDLRDPETVRRAVENTDSVFHLGALIGVPYSYQHPREVEETNILGTLNVLIASRDQKVGRVIYASTSEVYGSARYTPIDESHPIHAQSPYAASKIGAEQLVGSFHASFGLPTVILRPFNIYGRRQSARAIIPTIITQILGDKPLELGTLSSTRDFTFVTDAVEALVLADRSQGAVGETFNIGSNFEVSIDELIDRVSALSGKRRPAIVRDEVRIRRAGSEVTRLWADNTRAADILGWRPTIPLDEGLKRTMRWIEANLERFRAGVYEI